MFEMDDSRFAVDIVSFERQMQLPLTENAGTTLDGVFHWEAHGRQEQYHIRFRAKPGGELQLQALWQQLQLARLHTCRFPGGDAQAYVISCTGKFPQQELEVRMAGVPAEDL